MARCDSVAIRTFSLGSLQFTLALMPAVSYLFHHCRLPLVESLEVRNTGTSPSNPLTVTVDIPGYALPLSLEIEALGPGHYSRISPLPLQLCYERLQGLEARRYAVVSVSADGRSVFRDEVLVLGFYEWPLAPAARKTLACYVQPGHAVVQQILADAAEFGEEGTPAVGAAGIRGDASSELRLLYETLRSRYSIRYTLEAPSYETDGQAVRPPHRVIPNPRTRAGSGTCIDLALLFASCLESLHLQPLVVVIRERENDGHHALVGCWSKVGERLEPVIESKQRLDRAVRAGRLLLLDPTGFTTVAGRKIHFDDAVTDACQRLTDGELVFALDVAAARETVVPLEFPMSPEVLSILAVSQRIARTHGSVTLETNHLLWAVLDAAGPRVGEFLIAEGLRSTGSHQDTDGLRESGAAPRATLNYRRCIDDARTIAGDCGAGFVEEEHLLYAILLSSSRAIDRELEARGHSRAALLRRFRSRFLWTRDLVSTEHGLERDDGAPVPSGPPEDRAGTNHGHTA